MSKWVEQVAWAIDKLDESIPDALKNEPGVVQARRSFVDALFELAERGLSRKDLFIETYKRLKGLPELSRDSVLQAEAIAHLDGATALQALGALVRESDHLAKVVSRGFFSGVDAERYVPFFKEILNWANDRRVKDWPESMKRARQIAERLGLEFESTEVVAALIIATAVIVSLYCYFFFQRRAEKNASVEFVEVSRNFDQQEWARVLLQGNSEQWTLAEAWKRCALDEELKRQAIEDLVTLKDGQLVQPERGASYVEASMVSDRTTGGLVWECERPGLRWKSELVVVEKARVVRAEPDYLALQASNPEGREQYETAFQARHSCVPEPAAMLEGELVEDVYDSLGGDLARYDDWLRSLIGSCPDRSLVPACADDEQKFVEKRMLSVNKLRAKADAHVEKRLHRGLIRRSEDGDEVLYRALVEAADREIEDIYDLM